ncbi:MAG: transcriptional regulator [Proteobacteria bacterium]|nr:MAG: transcriptional regulator [Pseudomonadota bacterium]
MKECSIDNAKMLEIYKIIGQNVKNIRIDKKVSQLKLALEIGHNSVGTISTCELCLNNKHFNIEHLVKIADVLEVDIKDFFEGI